MSEVLVLSHFMLAKDMGSQAASALLAVIGILVLAVILAVGAIIAGLWKTFQKAGKPGWAAIVPIYDAWVTFKIAGKPGWWALVALAGVLAASLGPALLPVAILADIIAWVLYIIAALEIAKRFGKSVWFAIFGLILVQPIGYCILGFGKAQYSAGVSGADKSHGAAAKSA